MAHRNSDRITPHRITVAGWDLTIYEESTDPEKASFDRTQIDVRADEVSLLTLDAAVNIRIPGHDELSFRTLETTLQAVKEFSIERGADVAAERIFNPAEPLRNRNGILALSGVRLGDREEAWRCGDCEVWTKKGNIWSSIFPGDMLAGPARAEYNAAVRGMNEYDAWEVQEQVLGELDAWESPMIGFSERSHAQYANISGFDEVIVTTDGARMSAEHADNLAEWMTESIHIAPVGHPYPSPHGDLAVIHARRL